VAGKLYQDSQDSTISFNESIDDWRVIQGLVKRQSLKIVDEELHDVSAEFENLMRESKVHRPGSPDVGKTLLNTAMKAKTAGKENLGGTYTQATENVVLVTNDANIRQKARSASIITFAFDSIRARLLRAAATTPTTSPG
jgi:hypothetical protein